jgi:hypothetical protein
MSKIIDVIWFSLSFLQIIGLIQFCVPQFYEWTTLLFMYTLMISIIMDKIEITLFTNIIGIIHNFMSLIFIFRLKSKTFYLKLWLIINCCLHIIISCCFKNIELNHGLYFYFVFTIANLILMYILDSKC